MAHNSIAFHRIGTWFVLTLALGLSGHIHAKDFNTVQITTTPLSDTVYMLKGFGGNIGVSAGADGVFIIDDQYAPLNDKITASIAKFSDQPIRFIINTHWHHDHTDGNENFGKTGSVIIAHDNARTRLAAGQVIEFFQNEVEPAPIGALPVVTFNDQISLHLNGESVRVYHIAHAHTDGDAIIHFPASNVIHLGDIYFSTGYPFIDRSSGGSFQGVLKGIEFALSLSDDNTKIIPGHGPLADISDLQRYYDMLITVRSAIQAHIDAGHGLKETVAAQPTQKLDAEWAEYFIDGDQITTLVWQSLTYPPE